MLSEVSNHKLNPATQSRFRLLIFALSLMAFVSALLPHFAKAGVMDELSGNLQRTVQQVTNSATSPIRQVEDALGGAVNQVEGAIDNITQAIDNVLGGFNRTIQSFLAPFQRQLQQYLQIFNISFRKILDEVFGSIFGKQRQPWDEQWGAVVNRAQEEVERAIEILTSRKSSQVRLEFPISFRTTNPFLIRFWAVSVSAIK